MDQQRGRAPAKYRQISSELRARIEKGEFPVGSQLPAKRELMDAYGAADATVSAALRELRQLGMIESRQGAGSFVIAAEPDIEPSPAMKEILKRIGELDDEITRLHERMDSYEQRVQA